MLTNSATKYRDVEMEFNAEAEEFWGFCLHDAGFKVSQSPSEDPKPLSRRP